MHTYEIEIKTLLGSDENAQKMREKLATLGAQKTGSNSQLNHYFEGGDFILVRNALMEKLTDEKNAELLSATENGTNHSVRTRKQDDKVIFVIKYSLEEASDLRSVHGISRMEFEWVSDMTLEDLDQVLLDAGFTYQSKWSRVREEYSYEDFFITIDLNAGYGYLAEFELETKEPGDAVEDAKKRIESLMSELGVEELSQDRLDRMFKHYSAQWADYYGTDNVFTIE